MIHTTHIEFTGNKYKAEQLSLAHTNRLLEIFRNFNSFLPLLVNTHLEPFFDDTGKFVGSIHLATNYGIEVVTVNVPSGVGKEQERVETMDLIVPLLRSEDNKYWVACLSGTFEGPYYVFENTQEITAEEMDDNAETELDGKMISVGASPINGAGSPQLFFIAQTGTRPEDGAIGFDTSEFPDDDSGFDWKPWDQLEVQEKKEFILEYEAICCASASYATLETVVEYHTDVSYHGYVTVNGERLQYPPSDFNNTLDLSATLHMSQISFSTGDGCEIAKAIILYDWENDIDEIFEFTYLPGSGYVSNSATAEVENELNNISFVDVASFAASNREIDRSARTIVQREYEQCVVHDEELVSEKDYRAYTDYFLVGGSSFLLRTHAVNDQYPTYVAGENMLKYYSDDNAAATTGLFSALLFTPGGGSLPFAYHYVGPNNSDELSVTEFFSVEGAIPRKHIMANVPGIDDDVFFFGEIFLGRIHLEKKTITEVL